ncbi:hypothetical protein E2C01_101864 [Portunus trituberculatus]|uniref:Uncharacterized protein n=1 Tax=Portunus trituberculatus TaxID=210409 RepID=A0A5B7KAW4_PORTR|nr:hypothetical protein [Portunus trituberculatus]
MWGREGNGRGEHNEVRNRPKRVSCRFQSSGRAILQEVSFTTREGLVVRDYYRGSRVIHIFGNQFGGDPCNFTH